MAILSFLIPLVAIGLGFDAINGEHNRRTLSRVLAQPIYRDALLAGKFIAGLATLAITLVCLWLLVVGFGVLFLGVPPSGEEIARSLIFLAIAVVLCRGLARGGDAVLGAVPLAGDRGAAVARRLAVHDAAVADDRPGAGAGDLPAGHPLSVYSGLQSPETVQWQVALSRLSPNQLFGESVLAILSPSTRSLGPIFLDQIARRGDGRRAAAAGKPDDCLAASGRPDCRRRSCCSSPPMWCSSARR